MGNHTKLFQNMTRTARLVIAKGLYFIVGILITTTFFAYAIGEDYLSITGIRRGPPRARILLNYQSHDDAAKMRNQNISRNRIII